MAKAAGAWRAARRRGAAQAGPPAMRPADVTTLDTNPELAAPMLIGLVLLTRRPFSSPAAGRCVARSTA